MEKRTKEEELDMTEFDKDLAEMNDWNDLMNLMRKYNFGNPDGETK
jgi:hypothetical protein